MTRHTSRRHLLKGAAMLSAVPVAALGGVPVFDVVGEPLPLPQEPSPVMRLFCEWEALLDAQEAAYEAVKGQGMEAEDAVYEATAPDRRRIEEAMEAAPVTALQDLAAKIIVLSGDGTWCPPNAVFLECAALAGRDLDKLPRCLFEPGSSVG